MKKNKKQLNSSHKTGKKAPMATNTNSKAEKIKNNINGYADKK
jgi:hypothetical protein